MRPQLVAFAAHVRHSCLPTQSLVRGGILGAIACKNQQQRCLGTKYMAKIGLANQQWAEQAAKNARGEGQYFFDFLEERGYIQDVAGYA